MRVRFYWPECTNRGRSTDAPAVDAFWVEATQQEAQASVFPTLTPHQVEESRRMAKQFSHVANALGDPARAFCYLIVPDLSSVDPRPPHYPVHQLWNAYSPFKPISETTIADLSDLRSIAVPGDTTTSDGRHTE